jgi:hypothetical protein
MAPSRVSWIALVAAAGCFAPHPREGLPCDTACPAGQVCAGGVCWLEGTVPDAPGTNRADAGPDGAAGLHDEDGDGVADADDGCPHLAESAQVDGDNDGVNDGCDPRPMLPGERIAFFDPFTVQRAEWMFTTGTWQYPGETLEGSGDAVAFLATALGESTVEYSGRIVSLDGFPRQLTMVLSLDAMAGMHYCEVWDDEPMMPTPNFQIIHFVNSVYMLQDSVLLPQLAPGGFTFHGASSATGGTIACQLDLGMARHQVADAGPIVASDLLRVRLQGMTISLDYLIHIVTE